MINGKYDVIGDIHGHADVLRRLLLQMDYREEEGVFRHPDRQVIFVGDFIDRGPEQRDVLHIARNMCEAGAALAVMGNHEFNALGWAEPDGSGGFLRPHTEKNRDQHERFLDQIGEGSGAHGEALKWFRTLPIWLDFPGLRVVHACWNSSAQRVLKPYLDLSQRFTPDGLRAASHKSSERPTGN
jgi:predicted MPP superfamily phosphohydrolase